MKGEEVIITKGNKPLVRLEPLVKTKPQRKLGGCKGYVLFIANDFDEPLKDFKDCMK